MRDSKSKISFTDRRLRIVIFTILMHVGFLSSFGCASSIDNLPSFPSKTSAQKKSIEDKSECPLAGHASSMTEKKVCLDNAWDNYRAFYSSNTLGAAKLFLAAAANNFASVCFSVEDIGCKRGGDAKALMVILDDYGIIDDALCSEKYSYDCLERLKTIATCMYKSKSRNACVNTKEIASSTEALSIQLEVLEEKYQRFLISVTLENANSILLEMEDDYKPLCDAGVVLGCNRLIDVSQLITIIAANTAGEYPECVANEYECLKKIRRLALCMDSQQDNNGCIEGIDTEVYTQARPSFSDTITVPEASSRAQSAVTDIEMIRETQALLGKVLSLSEQYENNSTKLRALIDKFEQYSPEIIVSNRKAASQVVSLCDNQIPNLVVMQISILDSVSSIMPLIWTKMRQLEKINTPNTREFLSILSQGSSMTLLDENLISGRKTLTSAARRMKEGCEQIKSGLSGMEKSKSKKKSRKNFGGSPRIVTREKFERIEIGYSYRKVVGIMGEEGVLDFQAVNISVYSWQNSDGVGVITITFIDDAVSSKAQMLL